MIAKKEWFERRKYLGWGVHPKTWQGWAYIIGLILIVMLIQSLPFWTDEMRFYITIGFVGFILIDILPLMFTVNRDEREHKIEAVSERNAAWFMAMVLTGGLVYDLIIGALNQQINVNWFIVIALFGGSIVKTITNIVLERKGE
jgi:hypothetical protein